MTGIRTTTGTAFVTFVALDENGKPLHVPKLSLKTDEDRIKFEEGKIRMEKRLQNRSKYNSDFGFRDHFKNHEIYLLLCLKNKKIMNGILYGKNILNH